MYADYKTEITFAVVEETLLLYGYNSCRRMHIHHRDVLLLKKKASTVLGLLSSVTSSNIDPFSEFHLLIE